MFINTTPQKTPPIRIQESRCVFDAITPNRPIVRYVKLVLSSYSLQEGGGGQMRDSGNEVGRFDRVDHCFCA